MKKYNGVLIPLVTPFDQTGKIHHRSFEKLLDHIIGHHCHPMALGTTGEAASMSESQKTVVIRSLGRFKGKATLYAGISDTCFTNLVDRAKKYADGGIDVLVAHLPVYYPLSQTSMMTWFESLAEKSPLPLVIYNIPATTHVSIPLEIIDSLSHHEKIVGVKDSERSEERLGRSVTLWKNRQDFSHFTGWAAQSFAALDAGSDGIVPSSGNLLPQVYDILYKAAAKKDTEMGLRTQQLSDELGRLYQQGRLLGESLAALKAILSGMNLCTPFTLPPVFSLALPEQKRLQQQFADYYSSIAPFLNTLITYE